MRVMAAQNLAVEHARQKDVVGKLRLARALGAGIDLAEWFADYLERLSVIAVLCHHPRISHRWARIDTDSENKTSNRWIDLAVICEICIYPWLLLFVSVNTFTRQFHLFTTHSGRRQLNRFVNLDVAGAAAQIS